MKSKNICKFINPSVPNEPFTLNFVLETNPDTMRAEAVLKYHRAVLITAGEGCFEVDKTKYNLSTGCLLFGFKEETFSVDFSQKCEYMYIDFYGSRAEELFRRFGIGKGNRNFKGFDGLIPLWIESLCRAGEQTIDLASESMLLFAFSRFSSENIERNGIVNRMVELSEEHFTNSSLSITLLADELGYNGKYLSHIFKEKMGIGYSEYLRAIRIKYAVSLFDHGIDSVKNVALLSGFSDPLYFSTVFKKNVGVTPTEYKNNLKK